jgi:phosphatidylserine/phosphatidylglycerophosphate/cardiolipin synthase-like enzyme
VPGYVLDGLRKIGPISLVTARDELFPPLHNRIGRDHPPDVGRREAPGRNMLAHKSLNRAALPYLLTAWLGASGALAQEIHYSPEERLDAIDVALIAGATRSIDFASYSLTDRAVLDALNAADRCGVAIWIVLDPRERHDFVRLGDLADNVRIKHSGPLMHLKAYAIDGELLRTGSANFSASGERQQDNDLIIIRDAAAAAMFDAHFERMWDAAQPMDEFEPAIRALEPNEASAKRLRFAPPRGSVSV